MKQLQASGDGHEYLEKYVMNNSNRTIQNVISKIQ